MFNFFRRKKPEIIVSAGAIDIQAIKLQAEQYYRDGDFYCSEAVVKAIKDAFNAPYDDSVIKLASGFPVGMSSGCTCGAVSGAVMALGMFFGRSEAKGKEVKKMMKLAKEVQDTFNAEHKVCCCKILTKNMRLGSAKHMSQCTAFTGKLTEIVAMIIVRELGLKEIVKK